MAVQGDAYAKGWEQGRRDAIKEAKATLIRALPIVSVTIHSDNFIPVEETLAILTGIENGDQPYARAAQSRRR